MPDPIDSNSPAAAILSGAPMPVQDNPQPPANMQARDAAAQTPAPQVNAQPQAPSLSALGVNAPSGPTYGAAGASDSRPADPNKAAMVQHQSKMAALGQLASRLFSGQHVEYSADENGNIVRNVVKEKPGEIFRNLLAGSLMGMAAGSSAHDFAGGAGRGAEAVMQNTQQQDQRRYERAQQDLANQRTAQQQTEDRKFREAQIAQMNNTNLLAESELNLHTQQFIDGLNQREQAYQEHLEEIGAHALPLNFGPGGSDINGVQGNGKILQRQGVKDLDSLKAPDGYHTVHTMSTDMNGLSLKNGQWVDGQGNPVNLEDRTTHRLYALPDSIWNEDSGIRTGAELNKIAGFHVVDDDARIHPTVGDVTGIKAKGAAIDLERAKVQVDAMKARLEAANTRRQLELTGKQLSLEQSRAMTASYQATKETVDSLTKQLNEEANLLGHEQETAEIREQLNEATDDLNEIRKQLFPNTVIKPKGKNPPGGPAPKPMKPPKPGTPITPNVVKGYLDANGGDPAKATKAALGDGWYVPGTK